MKYLLKICLDSDEKIIYPNGKPYVFDGKTLISSETKDGIASTFDGHEFFLILNEVKEILGVKFKAIDYKEIFGDIKEPKDPLDDVKYPKKDYEDSKDPLDDIKNKK